MNRVDIRIGSLTSNDPNIMRDIERACDARERGVEAVGVSLDAQRIADRIRVLLDESEANP